MERDRLALAVAVAALVPTIYAAALPSLAEVQAGADAPHIAASERAAGFTAAAVVAGIAAASGSGEVLVIGGAMTAAYCLLYRRARQTVSPQ
jgi:precorrin isomerase